MALGFFFFAYEGGVFVFFRIFLASYHVLLTFRVFLLFFAGVSRFFRVLAISEPFFTFPEPV